MKKQLSKPSALKFMLTSAVFSVGSVFAQTNVFDDVIATSPNHTILEAALIQAQLDDDLQAPAGTFTVFAPDDNAFNELASNLGVTTNDLLNLPNLADILLYHVLGTEVPAANVTNGAVVNPLSTTNTLKLTKTSTNAVFVNQASVTTPNLTTDNGIVHVINKVVLPSETVVDVAIDNNFTTLVAAVVQEELVPTLSDPFGTFTVFAPNNAAFDTLAVKLNTNLAGLLALPNLTDVLTYHVLGTEVASSAVTNGAVVNPLSTTNSLKLTKTSSNDVFVNHAEVILADVNASNGVVHVIDNVVLPVETVVDVALDNGFSTLATAVIQEELLPVLTDPFATFTVFAPSNAAFDTLAAKLNTNISGLLALPNLTDVLTYHVLGTEVASSAVTNGAVVAPLSATNTLKLTKTSTNNIFVNHAQVTLADVSADNGVVHAIDNVVLPVETVVDVALDNGFSTLATAVIQEELIPILSNPFAQFTVFAPTNTAFDNLATALGTDLNGILALSNLTDVLTYHVIADEVLSTELTAGPVATVNGANVIISVTPSVKVNDANVTTADVQADNGVVHVIDKVILESFLNITSNSINELTVYPNPAENSIAVDGVTNGKFEVIGLNGAIVSSGDVSTGTIDVSTLTSGYYTLKITDNNSNLFTARILKK